MKLSSTVILTLILLMVMVGAGYASAIFAYGVGHEALKSVTKPDSRPEAKIKAKKPTSQKEGAVVLVKEQDIIANVKQRISGKGKKARPEKRQSQDKQSNNDTSPKAQLVADKEPLQPGFPISSNKDKGVTLNVQSVRYTGGALLLKVNFKNEGDRTVKFLYSFMDITDDRGRVLSANTEGLPAEIPPDGKNFVGTVSIPTALLDDVKKLSLKLTDYPDQKLQLQVANVPVSALVR